MKAHPECIACMFTQALNTVKAIGGTAQQQLDVMQRLAARVAVADLDHTPAFVSQDAYTVVSEVTGVDDPYATHKQASNRLALRLLPGLRQKVLQAPDPLLAAIHLAAAGNIIDAGIGHDMKVDVEQSMLEMLNHPFGIMDIDDFRAELGPGKRLLYLGDNAGEIVFDTVLVDQIRQTGTEVTYSVKSAPVINDATLEDAEVAGMAAHARVLTTGSNDIGIHFGRASKEFLSAFATADCILSKGQGNYETCNDRPENLYFLLKAKCDLVAAALGVRYGELVFTHAHRRHLGDPVPPAPAANVAGMPPAAN